MELMKPGQGYIKLAQNVEATLDPAKLPWIWPLPTKKEDRKPDLDAFRTHLKACNEGNIPRVNAELARCAQNVPYWVMTHCFTKDEHDANNPVKRFPRKRYVVTALNELCTHNLIAIPKSRQIMITWTCLCYILHRAMFNKYRLIFVQSKKEEDAVALIDRVKHVYEHLPWWMKQAAPTKRPLDRLPFNKLILANGSIIWGIPQGEDVVRQHTASIILSDEGAFQTKSEAAYTAAKPTIDGGGQYIIVSSANGKNFFYRVCHDKLDNKKRVA